MLLVCICSNLKSVLRYKFVSFAIIRTHCIYMIMLFFETQRGPQAKTFVKRWTRQNGQRKEMPQSRQLAISLRLLSRLH